MEITSASAAGPRRRGRLGRVVDPRYWRLPIPIMRHLARRTVGTAYGVPMLANWGDATFELGWRGWYGKALSRLLAEQAAPFVFVDIGANQGLYSLLAATNPHCRHVHAFEPVPATFALLEGNIALNRIGGRVTAHPFAVSDRDGEAEMSVPADHSGAATLGAPLAAAARQRVTLRTLTGLAPAIVPTDLPLVVKIDVEGHEQVVLSQLVASGLVRRATAVFYEVDERWSDAAALEAILRAAGFVRFSRHGGDPTHYDVLARRA